LNSCLQELEHLARSETGCRKAAWVKTLFYSAVAAVEDYKTCGLKTDLHVDKTSWVSRKIESSTIHVNPENCGALYDRSTNPRGSYCLTLTTVENVLGRKLDRSWEQKVLKRNIGHHEWSVAAIILGMNSMRSDLLLAIIEANWFELPLFYWIEGLSNIILAVRRCPWIKGVADDVMAGYDLRKILNCCDRTKGDADWDNVKDKMFSEGNIHFAIDKEGRLDRDLWKTQAVSLTQRICDLAVQRLVTESDIPSIQDWWDSRWGWSPSGSTSSKSKVHSIIDQDGRLEKQTRGNKKAVLEQRQSDYMAKVLTLQPGDVARGSTKQEPGNKLRDLEAQTDEAFFVSSYASLGIEKSMNIEGMIGKQTPNDIAQWVLSSNRLSRNDCWLSMDYKAFNLHHEQRDICNIDYCFMNSWNKFGYSEVMKKEKMECCLWSGRAHSNRFLKLKDDWSRSLNGLWSGHRNTSRDNTILHKVYSDMALLDMSKLLGRKIMPKDVNIHGDDEDLKFSHWIETLLYYTVHKLQNHVLKASKQMAGVVHEFLQRIAVPNKHVLRPMWSMLAQTASGNWYKENFVWYGACIQSISDNCWELFCRGMPFKWARRLAVNTLNAQLRVPLDDGLWKKMEWWQYRHGENGHPLWVGTPGLRKKAPKLTPKVIPNMAVSCNASTAWLSKLEKRVNIWLSERQRQSYLDESRADSYNKMYIKNRIDNQKVDAKDGWPERETEITDSMLDKGYIEEMPMNLVLSEISAQPGDRRPASMDEVASRFGMDAKFIESVGGMNVVISRLHPKYAMRYEQPAEVRLVDWRYHRADDAITSWASNTQAISIKHPQPSVRTCENYYSNLNRKLYLAPNMAGKTTATERWIKQGLRCMDIDNIHELRNLETRAVDGWVSTSLSEQLAADYINKHVLGGAYDRITTQRVNRHLVDILDARVNYLHIVVVDPGIKVLLQRGKARNWTSDLVFEKYNRWKEQTESLINKLKRNGFNNISYNVDFD